MKIRLNDMRASTCEVTERILSRLYHSLEWHTGVYTRIYHERLWCNLLISWLLR